MYHIALQLLRLFFSRTAEIRPNFETQTGVEGEAHQKLQQELSGGKKPPTDLAIDLLAVMRAQDAMDRRIEAGARFANNREELGQAILEEITFQRLAIRTELNLI